MLPTINYILKIFIEKQFDSKSKIISLPRSTSQLFDIPEDPNEYKSKFFKAGKKTKKKMKGGEFRRTSRLRRKPDAFQPPSVMHDAMDPEQKRRMLATIAARNAVYDTSDDDEFKEFLRTNANVQNSLEKINTFLTLLNIFWQNVIDMNLIIENQEYDPSDRKLEDNYFQYLNCTHNRDWTRSGPHPGATNNPMTYGENQPSGDPDSIDPTNCFEYTDEYQTNYLNTIYDTNSFYKSRCLLESILNITCQGSAHPESDLFHILFENGFINKYGKENEKYTKIEFRDYNPVRQYFENLPWAENGYHKNLLQNVYHGLQLQNAYCYLSQRLDSGCRNCDEPTRYKRDTLKNKVNIILESNYNKLQIKLYKKSNGIEYTKINAKLKSSKGDFNIKYRWKHTTSDLESGRVTHRPTINNVVSKLYDTLYGLYTLYFGIPSTGTSIGSGVRKLKHNHYNDLINLFRLDNTIDPDINATRSRITGPWNEESLNDTATNILGILLCKASGDFSIELEILLANQNNGYPSESDDMVYVTQDRISFLRYSYLSHIIPTLKPKNCILSKVNESDTIYTTNIDYYKKEDYIKKRINADWIEDDSGDQILYEDGDIMNIYPCVYKNDLKELYPSASSEQIEEWWDQAIDDCYEIKHYIQPGNYNDLGLLNYNQFYKHIKENDEAAMEDRVDRDNLTDINRAWNSISSITEDTAYIDTDDDDSDDGDDSR